MTSQLTLSKSYTEPPPSTTIANIPEDVLGSKIFSMLLDPEKAESIASISRVCQEWRDIMSTDLPFAEKIQEKQFFERYPRMAVHRVLAKSDRELYLSYFPKTLRERMKLAWVSTQLNTTDFEAKHLFTLALTFPHVYSAILNSFLSLTGSTDEEFPIFPLSLFALSFCPATLHPTRARDNAWAFRMVLFAIIAASLLIVRLEGIDILFHPQDTCPNIEPKSKDIIDRWKIPLIWVFSYGMHSLRSYEEDTLLSKTYRIAKGSMSASVPLIKTTYRRLKTMATGLSSKVHSLWSMIHPSKTASKIGPFRHSTPMIIEEDERESCQLSHSSKEI